MTTIDESQPSTTSIVANPLESFVVTARSYAQQREWSSLFHLHTRCRQLLRDTVDYLDLTLEQLLPVLDHTLSWLTVLHVWIDSHQSTDQPHNNQRSHTIGANTQLHLRMRQFAAECDSHQVALASDVYACVFVAYTQYVLELSTRHRDHTLAVCSLRTLLLAVERLQADPSQLTSLHSCVCRMALHSRCFPRRLTRMLDTHITSIHNEGGHLDSVCLHLYFYHAALVYTALGEYSRAVHFLYTCQLCVTGGRDLGHRSGRQSHTSVTVLGEARARHYLLSLLVYVQDYCHCSRYQQQQTSVRATNIHQLAPPIGPVHSALVAKSSRSVERSATSAKAGSSRYSGRNLIGGTGGAVSALPATSNSALVFPASLDARQLVGGANGADSTHQAYTEFCELFCRQLLPPTFTQQPAQSPAAQASTLLASYSTHRAHFQARNDLGLVKQCLHAHARARVQQLTRLYVAVPLQTVIGKAALADYSDWLVGTLAPTDLPSGGEGSTQHAARLAERLLLLMIDERKLEAHIDQVEGVVHFTARAGVECKQKEQQQQAVNGDTTANITGIDGFHKPDFQNGSQKLDPLEELHAEIECAMALEKRLRMLDAQLQLNPSYVRRCNRLAVSTHHQDSVGGATNNHCKPGASSGATNSFCDDTMSNGNEAACTSSSCGLSVTDRNECEFIDDTV